jgi:AcrR family transcriptional regulator
VPSTTTDPDTRTRLLRAAAHLYARKGIDGVRNHEIHTLAGQRNESAIHYHFGGRWKVVAAILDENELAAAPVVEAHRDALQTPEAVVAFLIDRLSIGLGSPEGRDWLRIVSELMARFSEQATPFSQGSSGGVEEIADRLCRQVAGVPKTVVRRRAIAMVRFMTARMAERARQIDEGVPGELLGEAQFLDELASMSLGIVTAPTWKRPRR